jgi:hypothetical protein
MCAILTPPLNMASSSAHAEVFARVHFVRVFGVVADHHGLQWRIVGGFLRRMLSGAPLTDTNLDMILSPKSSGGGSGGGGGGPTLHGMLSFASNVQKALKELEILGFVRNIVKGTDTHQYTCTAIMCIDADGTGAGTSASTVIRETTFEFVVNSSSRTEYDYTCTTDALSLCSALGLVSARVKEADRVNTSQGIMLLDRLAELYVGQTRMCGTYLGASDDVLVRQRNCRLMLREHKLRSDGMAVVGNVLESVDNRDVCPVCLDAKPWKVKIACTHAFCIPCLAKHMSLDGDNYGHCPMCRAPIEL